MSLLVKRPVFHHSKIILFHFLFWSCALYILYGYISFLIYDWQIFSHNLWLISCLSSCPLKNKLNKKINEAYIYLFFSFMAYMAYGFWYYIYVCLTKDLKYFLLCFLLEVL